VIFYEAILTSKEGWVDVMAQLAYELEALEAAKRIEVEHQRAGVPDEN
jgi:hypothetical protein